MQGTELKNHVLALCEAVETTSVAGSSMLGLTQRVRELCARAMCEPDMAEVERLLEAYDHEYASGGSVEDYDCARTALLDYVRGVIAERDELIADNERLSGLYEQAVKGRADMRSALRDARAAAHAGDTKQMTEVERLADEYASAVHDGRDNDCATTRTALLDYVRGHFVVINKIVVAKCDGNHGGPRCADPECWNDEATHQPISAADVPMPEPDSGCSHIDHLYLVWNEDQMRNYGDAREAAGYARGLKEVNTALNDVFSAADGLSSAIDAALRVVVKT